MNEFPPGVSRLLAFGTWLAMTLPCIAPAATIQVTRFSVPTTYAYPGAIVNGADGNLWFAETFGYGEGKLGRITPDGVITEFGVSGPSPASVALGPDGNLWFTTGLGAMAPAIGVMTPAGALTHHFPFDNPWAYPQRMVTGPNGELWYTDPDAHQVDWIDAGGTLTRHQLDETFRPSGIADGPDGNLWFTETNGHVGKITTSGVVTAFVIPSAGVNGSAVTGIPGSIANGPDGNLWFAEHSSSCVPCICTSFGGVIARVTPDGAITEFALRDTSAVVNAVVTGPDGNLWFTESVGRIGRIAMNGEITEFPLQPGSAPADIVSGPDGNLWFTDSAGNQIARVRIDADSVYGDGFDPQ